MKKLAFLTALCLITLFSKAQIRPVDSLYLWVSFTDKNILVEIPDSYLNYRSTIPHTPAFVKMRNMMVLVPDLPSPDKLITLLHNETNESNHLISKEDKLKYLGKVVLLTWYSKTYKEEIPNQVIKKVKQLSQQKEVEKEATLLLTWLIGFEQPRGSQ